MQPITHNGKIGWIEVIVGCMFSGKTEELIKRLRRERIAGVKVVNIKHVNDKRYSDDYMDSHSGQQIECVLVNNTEDIFELSEGAQVVGIDEGQFFDSTLTSVCEKLASQGKRVIVAGLDTDYRGLPFGPMPELMLKAEFITKTLAVCMKCRNHNAIFTQRVTKEKETVVVGEKDKYQARCRNCFEPPEES